jgi:tRNA A-37 threonylcarbamoyl transferase component Bud32
MAAADPRARLEGVPRHVWAVAGVLALALVYSVLEIGVVRPRMSADDPSARVPGVLLARPTPAALDGGQPTATDLEEWRRGYATGPEGPGLSGDPSGWVRAHSARILQVVVFIGAAIVLFALRSHDLTAALSVLALALSGVAAGGPLYGTEHGIPLGSVLTVFTWLAGPCAFPIIALAVLYFPSRSPRLARFPALHVVPFVAAAPMIAGGVMTSLYLIGVDGARDGALWDATHPGVFYASFAAALGINVLVIIEGIHRYRFNHDANERRRIRVALYTGVPGVLAYAVKDGVPIVVTLVGGRPQPWPWLADVFLQLLILLPAFGLVYAVGVARVLGPRVVLRRSLQYALASRTLTVLAVLPAAALIFSLARDPQARVRDVVTSIYVVPLAISIAAFMYRERARQWLDLRFFRQEYDARKILLSLASRVRFETDPSDLAAMVVHQIDEALRPELVAILVSGIEDGRLLPVTVLHGSAESLPLAGGLVAMLRWSDEPLEIFINDPRSPVRRLPAEEQEWLECTRAVLLVPVVAQDKSLVGVMALGERKSEEAYTAEDRELLASIASQMGLGFDVARLRRRIEDATGAGGDTTRLLTPLARPMMECLQCGRCEDVDVATCPADGSTLRPSSTVPRVLDDKYRLEQLLGRGGMGAVYQARDMRLDRLVAVKVVRAELIGDPEARRRFRREAQIVARLQHPGIVSVFDYGTVGDGAAYLVMELVRGDDLRRVMVREGPLDPDRAARILSSVCIAIESAHRQGVLHRDLKPENILLPGDDGEAKVVDFGVAKVIVEDRREATVAADRVTLLTMEGAVVGTPAYMAPEQLRGQTPDARTDVFSLGVIAYEMLTASLPFGRGSVADVVLAQARGIPPGGIDGLSPALARAVGTALEADPDRRPPSPQAFAHLINAAKAANAPGGAGGS